MPQHPALPKEQAMALDHYVSLGRSGLRVSPFCLGTMTFGEEWGFGSSPEASHRILDHYIERGGNFIDTANTYNRGHSEKIIGDYLANDKSRRDRLVVATKFGANLYTGNPNGGGASRKAIVSAAENSLRRLRTDYIDLYWLHWWDSFTPIEETLQTLDDLVRAGKVRYLGFSDTPAWKVSQAQTTALFRGWAPLTALQIEYSLLERTVEGELIPMARELGLGITPWSPLRSGVLSGKYTRENTAATSPGRSAWIARNLNEEAFRVIEALMGIGTQIGTTAAQVALAWVRSRPGVTSPILGARTIEQLRDNIAALEVSLSATQIKTLEDISRPKLSFPVDFLRNAQTATYGGMTIDGTTFPVNPMAAAKSGDVH
jgi:aryl-alcohol dehydrogenase-like predicted oxidoreductase